MLLSSLTLVLSLTLPFQDAAAPADEPEQVAEADAIACRLDVPSYMQFALALGGKDGIARQRGWKKVSAGNAFMDEYQLPAPITVAGTYRTQRIAFTGDSILAVLDLADPAMVARPEKIDNSMDLEPMIASIVASGKATRAQVEAEFKFRKFLGERVLKDTTVPAGKGESFGSHTTVARTIANTTTHPGKTLYGCAYRIEVLDEDGKPL